MADKGTPDGIHRVKATEDDDVEGHRYAARTTAEPDGIHRVKATEDDDVEGHSIRLRSPSSRGE